MKNLKIVRAQNLRRIKAYQEQLIQIEHRLANYQLGDRGEMLIERSLIQIKLNALEGEVAA